MVAPTLECHWQILSKQIAARGAKDMFRSKYEELKERAEAAKSKRSTLQTDHYEDSCGFSSLEQPKLVEAERVRGCSETESAAFWRAQAHGQVPKGLFGNVR